MGEIVAAMAMLQVNFNFDADEETLLKFMKDCRGIVMDNVDMHGWDSADNVTVQVHTKQHILLGSSTDPCAVCHLTVVENEDFLRAAEKAIAVKKDRNSDLSQAFGDLCADQFKI